MKKAMRAAALLILPVMLAACTDDGSGPVHGDLGNTVTMIRLQVGADVVDIISTGALTPVDFTQGEVLISAEFRDENDRVVDLDADEGFQVNVVPTAGNRLAFQRTGAFSGLLTGLLSGATSMQVELVHNGHLHFGPHVVTVNVLPQGDGED